MLHKSHFYEGEISTKKPKMTGIRSIETIQKPIGTCKVPTKTKKSLKTDVLDKILSRIETNVNRKGSRKENFRCFQSFSVFIKPR